MSKKSKTNFKQKSVKVSAKLRKIKQTHGVTEYVLTTNDLHVLYMERPLTGVVTSDIVYFVGSRDEARGETGLAHMFEHMLFKPTYFDIARKTDSGATCFERETGINFNANTWKDRTSYYFSYPKEHFDRALLVEAERMHGLVLTNKEFKPEQGNVLSEFDMHAGNEHFLLSVQMMAAAFESHPYGHETIGFREDIEDYTIEKLDAFYRKYYAPNNATLIIVGDVNEREMKRTVLKHFAKLEKSKTLQKRLVFREPIQEGNRTVTVQRPSTIQLYAVGLKHDAFPTKSWFEAMIIADMLTGGSDSILHKKLIDTGLASSAECMLEPSREANLAILFITLTQKCTHEKMSAILRKIIDAITVESMAPYLKKTLAKTLTSEQFTRENSLGFVSELVEYVSADAWEKFFESEKILSSITPMDIKTRLHKLFDESQLTIGNFKGTK